MIPPDLSHKPGLRSAAVSGGLGGLGVWLLPNPAGYTSPSIWGIVITAVVFGVYGYIFGSIGGAFEQDPDRPITRRHKTIGLLLGLPLAWLICYGAISAPADTPSILHTMYLMLGLYIGRFGIAPFLARRSRPTNSPPASPVPDWHPENPS